LESILLLQTHWCSLVISIHGQLTMYMRLISLLNDSVKRKEKCTSCRSCR